MRTARWSAGAICALDSPDFVTLPVQPHDAASKLYLVLNVGGCDGLAAGDTVRTCSPASPGLTRLIAGEPASGEKCPDPVASRIHVEHAPLTSKSGATGWEKTCSVKKMSSRNESRDSKA